MFPAQYAKENLEGDYYFLFRKHIHLTGKGKRGIRWQLPPERALHLPTFQIGGDRNIEMKERKEDREAERNNKVKNLRIK